MSSMTSPIDAPYAHSYRLPIGHELLNRLVSKILSKIKLWTNADRQTDTHIDKSNDNKGRLKLAACEPIHDPVIPAVKRTIT